jgi:hypothetical protein
MSAMSGDFSHIACCADLTASEAEDAVRSRATARGLLEHLAEILVSIEDATCLVRVLARLATEDAAGWVEGWLEADLINDGDATVIETVTSLGGGLRERLLPRLKLNVPRADLVRALERSPGAIEPLCVLHGDDGRVKLVPAATGLRSVKPRPAIAIAGDSLVGSVPPLPPEAPHDLDAPVAAKPVGSSEVDSPLTDLDEGWDA